MYWYIPNVRVLTNTNLPSTPHSTAYLVYCDRGLGRVSLQSYTPPLLKIKMRFNGSLTCQVCKTLNIDSVKKLCACLFRHRASLHCKYKLHFQCGILFLSCNILSHNNMLTFKHYGQTVVSRHCESAVYTYTCPRLFCNTCSYVLGICRERRIWTTTST